MSKHCYFATYLASLNLSPQTIRTRRTCIGSAGICISASVGFPDPRDQSSLPLLKRVQAGIQRVHAGR